MATGGKIETLVRRQFLMLFAPLAVLVVVTAFAVGHVILRGTFDRMMTEDRALVRLGVDGLRGDLMAPWHHIQSLPHEMAIRRAIDHSTPARLAAMGASFVTLLQRNPDYDQVRWIDESGRERVRVDKSPDGRPPAIVPGDALQNKAGRSYFDHDVGKPIGSLIFSSLDLNVEHGKVEVPFKPVLRVATPVADAAGHRRGIIIINVLMNRYLRSFMNLGGGRIMLADRNGDLLCGPTPQGQWRVVVGRGYSLKRRFPVAWSRMIAQPTGQFVVGSGLWSWDRITPASLGLKGVPPHGNPDWLVVAHRSDATIRGLTDRLWDGTAAIVLPLLLIFAAMSWHLARRAKLRMEAVTAAARAEARSEEHQRQIAALEESEKRLAVLAAIVASSDDAIIGKTLDGVITSWNPGAERLYGYTADQILGQHMQLLFPPGAESEEEEILQRIGRGQRVHHLVTRRRHRDGRLLDVSVTVSPIYDRDGAVIGVSNVARDISDLKRAHAELQAHRDHLEEMVAARTAEIRDANEELRAQKKFITTITDNLPGRVGYWDTSLHCRYANAAYAQSFGRPVEQILGCPMEDVADPAFIAEARFAIEAVLAGRPQSFEREIKTRSGAKEYSQVHYIPDFRDGSVAGFFVLPPTSPPSGRRKSPCARSIGSLRRPWSRPRPPTWPKANSWPT